MSHAEETGAPSSAELVAAVVEGRGKADYMGVTKVVSVRMPLHLFLRIQALSHRSGRTKNAMIIGLLDAGIEEVSKLLNPETLKELNDLEVEATADQIGSFLLQEEQ